MSNLAEVMKTLTPVKVLDVATGTGFFASVLKENLGSYTEIVGVDQKPFDAGRMPLFTETGMSYQQMDATHLEFEDAIFDLVAISNSLHHLPDPAIALVEMVRVLKPGGSLLVFEMYSDGQTAQQQNHVDLHKWWAKIDTAGGVFHAPTYDRAELINLLKCSGIVQWELHDIADVEDDPLDPELLASIDGIIDSYISKTTSLSAATDLASEGESLRKRVRAVGFRSAVELLAVGKK